MNKAAAKSYAMVLKAIYDADWAEEKDILNYYKKDEGEKDPGFDAAKHGAGPFLKWLETAESDNDDDDDDDEEDKDKDSDEDLASPRHVGFRCVQAEGLCSSLRGQ